MTSLPNRDEISPRRLLLILKCWKAYLHFKHALIQFELRLKKLRALYLLKLYLAAPFSWRKKIALLEYRRRYEKAIARCEKKLYRLNGSAYARRAEIYEILGRNQRNLNLIESAMESLQQAQKLDPQSPSVSYEIGLIHFIRRNYPQARRAMESALRRGYDTPSLRIHLGKVYYQMGLLNLAEECFQRVLQIYPQEGSIHFLLGIVYKSKVQYQMAIQSFSRAIQFGSDQKEEHLGLAEIYTRLGYWQEAIHEYQRILEFDPHNFIAHYFLGRIYEILGFEDSAIQEYIQANKIDPQDEDTKQKLTAILSTPIQEQD
ncbi:MAG: tetratricopeptide repeat protein [candidate division KSB1 bacterium]|nr:tetratricopeptide repeat protein [candidate division KSB1 bacterium]MDZ7341766.1 tetratricopeptide repeat protein [candidate division KSB1 bacterium]